MGQRPSTVHSPGVTSFTDANAFDCSDSEKPICSSSPELEPETTELESYSVPADHASLEIHRRTSLVGQDEATLRNADMLTKRTETPLHRLVAHWREGVSMTDAGGVTEALALDPGGVDGSHEPGPIRRSSYTTDSAPKPALIGGDNLTCTSILTLPPELMQLIFIERALDHPSGFDGDAVPTLSRVCFRWRQITLSVPILWSRWNFSPTVPLTCVQEWLARSSNCPLHISHTGFADRLIGAQIIEIYIQQAHRLESLSLRLADMVHFTPLKGHLPHLQKLQVSREVPYSFGSYEGLDTFAIAPALHEVVISAGVCMQVEIPWSQITHCQMRRVAAQQFLDVLSHATWLCSAVLEEVQAGAHLALIMAGVNLHYLEIISPLSCKFLNYFTSPNLQTFILKSTPSQGCVSSFIRRSSSSLRKLVIENMDRNVDCGFLIRCLRAAPNLVELHFRYAPGVGMGLTKDDVRLLTIEPRFIPIVPKLQILVASVHHLTSDRAVARVVMSRLMPNGWATAAKLQVVTLFSSRQMKAAVLGQLLNRRSAGLYIDIVFAQPDALRSYLYWRRKARRRARSRDSGSVDSGVLRYSRWRAHHPDYNSNNSG